MDKFLKVIKNSRKYLSYRAFLCHNLVFILFIILWINYMGTLGDGIRNKVPGLIFALILIVIYIISYMVVIRPYFKAEYEIRRMLGGYRTLKEPGAKGRINLTPAVEDAQDAVYKVLNSTQAVNMNKRQAQYLALQNQINPHFLYNTLDGIRSEALIAGLRNVAEMTEALAIFFRYTISNVENLVSIEDELDNCRTYFRIQQYRFGERLSLEIESEEDLGGFLIPKLTLQPILENSIIHGTEMKIGNGKTTISLHRMDRRILIEVKDDGVGMDEEKLETLNRELDSGTKDLNYKGKAMGGIALSNVNNRIHLLFGEEYGLHVYSLKDIGTTIEISIPAVTEEMERRKKAKDGE